jgi:hypothetical protein
MKVEKHIAADVAPGVLVRASQTGLMALILTSGFVSTNPETLQPGYGRGLGKDS